MTDQGSGYSSDRDDRAADKNALWQLSSDLMLRCTFAGEITAVNPAWTEVLGWTEAELVGSSLFDLVHPDDLHVTQEGTKIISDDGCYRRFDNRYQSTTGNYHWISWSTRIGDNLINAVGRDVTAQRQLEDQLRQSQKMEAVGQLTGGLAHDFNNLLTAITGSLALLQTRLGQDRYDDATKYIIAAEEAAKRAAALTHRLLAFSRRQTLDPKATNANHLIAGMEELLQRAVGLEVSIEVAPGNALCKTLIDPNQLENAILNLCINARDAMPGGGRIVIETKNALLDYGTAAALELGAGDYVSISVSDEGSGMPPDVVARAFDPFFTTKPMGQGTGLGLSMIYGFVRQSGGQARIHSEPGKGTKVILYLPKYSGAEDEPLEQKSTDEAPHATRHQTVLIVDDEPTIRMLLKEVLQDLDYRVLEAADGASGLKKLMADTTIDLLVTDVGLPGGMNGRQMADAARIHRPALKVLFITGFAETAVVSHGHLDDGMHVITKPFDLKELATKISELTKTGAVDP